MKFVFPEVWTRDLYFWRDGRNNSRCYSRRVCPTCPNGKCVYLSINKNSSSYAPKKCKPCCHVLKLPFKVQKPTIMQFGGDGPHCFAKKMSSDYKKENPSAHFEKVSPPIKIRRTRIWIRRAKSTPFMAYSSWLPIAWYS